MFTRLVSGGAHVTEVAGQGHPGRHADCRIGGRNQEYALVVYWIPAFAGMTFGAVGRAQCGHAALSRGWHLVPQGSRRADFIPAFAGMTVVPQGSRRADFIPAFAGMTVVPQGSRRADFIPAFAGMTVLTRFPSGFELLRRLANVGLPLLRGQSVRAEHRGRDPAAGFAEVRLGG